MIFNYIKSLLGGRPFSHRADQTFFLIVGAVFAGYTAKSLHIDFLKNFENPFIQFLIFYMIGISSYSGKMPPGGWGFAGWKVLWAGPYVFFDSLFAVILFQLLVYISHYYYEKKNEEYILLNDVE
mgnify:CR=1 FL=1